MAKSGGQRARENVLKCGTISWTVSTDDQQGWLDSDIKLWRALGGKKMKNRLKLAFVALLIAAIVWGILFYLILQDYREYMKD